MRDAGLLEADKVGKIALGVRESDGKVLIEFGQSITWMGLDPDQADAVASAIKHFAIIARAARPA